MLCLRMRADKERAYITISDNGHGIHPSIRTHLFEPYVTNKSSGTGVGLWLSKRILEKHKGSVRFRSSHEPGKSGTTFRVWLPIGIESKTPGVKTLLGFAGRRPGEEQREDSSWAAPISRHAFQSARERPTVPGQRFRVPADGDANVDMLRLPSSLPGLRYQSLLERLVDMQFCLIAA